MVPAALFKEQLCLLADEQHTVVRRNHHVAVGQVRTERALADHDRAQLRTRQQIAARKVVREAGAIAGLEAVGLEPGSFLTDHLAQPFGGFKVIDPEDLLHPGIGNEGASAFAALTKTIALTQCISVAISERAGAPLERANLSAIYIADAPNEDGLFAALEGALATLSA